MMGTVLVILGWATVLIGFGRLLCVIPPLEPRTRKKTDYYDHPALRQYREEDE